MQPEELPTDPDAVIRLCEEALASVSGEEAARLRYALAGALGERFRTSRDLADLDRAILLYRELRILPLDKTSYASVVNDLGEDLRLRFRETSQAQDLDEAVVCFREAADADPDPGYRMNVGNALRDRYLLQGRHGGDLDAALQAYEEAFAALPEGSPHRPLFAHSLACGLRDRHLRDGDDGDLERALELFRKAAETQEPAHLPEFLSNLATALDNRYERTSRLADLESAIEVHVRAVAACGSRHSARASALNNLGNALRNLGLRTRSRETVGRAVDAFREAIRITPEIAAHLPSRWNNLGNALRDRFALTGTEADLLEAIDAYRRGVARIEELGVLMDQVELYNNLANALRTLHHHRRDPGALEEAIGLYEQSFSATAELSVEYPGRASNLGNALLDRAALSVAPLASEDRRRGTGLLRRAAGSFDRSPEAALIAARNWSSWALAQELWDEAAEATRYALKATEKIFGLQTVRPAKEIWLGESQGIMAEAAYALARSGDLQGAVVALDRGLARLLSEALAVGGTMSSEETGVTFEVMRGLAAETPLVYLTFTLVGGVALLVRGTPPEVIPVWLPHLRQDPLLDLLELHFRSYAAWRRDPNNPGARAAWLASLDELAAWSWQAVVEKILPHLEGEPRVVLICSGLLSLIPWHAASPGGSESGRALDGTVFTYAPSARGLAAARQRKRAGMEGTLLAVAAPGRAGEPGFQPGLRVDAKIAAGSYARSLYLEGAAAGRQAVLEALPHHRVLHFSCHGYVQADEPAESGLRLDGGSRLTLRDFLELRLDQANLVVLSACESGISGLLLPDEVISLPTGLLQAGAAGVVSSMWAVDDVTTIYLMARFYHVWRHGADPAAALSAAQQWLRDTSNQEKLDFLQELRSESSQWLSGEILAHLRVDLLLRDPASHDFTDIHDWAAFTYVGA